MIKTIILSGELVEENSKYYFKNVDEVINEFLEKHNVEYVDLKVLDSDTDTIMLVYKEKGDE